MAVTAEPFACYDESAPGTVNGSALAAATPDGLVLHPAPTLIQRGVGEAGDVERVDDLDGVGEHRVEHRAIRLRQIQRRSLDARPPRLGAGSEPTTRPGAVAAGDDGRAPGGKLAAASKEVGMQVGLDGERDGQAGAFGRGQVRGGLACRVDHEGGAMVTEVDEVGRVAESLVDEGDRSDRSTRHAALVAPTMYGSSHATSSAPASSLVIARDLGHSRCDRGLGRHERGERRERTGKLGAGQLTAADSD